MIKLILTILLITTGLFSQEKKDDWDYNSTIPQMDMINVKSMPMMASAPAPIMMKKSLGLSVGGAKDANNFYENIKNSYLPKLDSITYEGVFYDHYFKVTTSECKDLFCPNYQTAVRNNLFDDKKEYFLSVGLDSNLDASKFKRKKLNLVVVLDISGSMSSPFDRYYYDRKTKQREDKKKSKMQIANESIASMIDHLKGVDSFGVVLFDNNSYLAKPLRKVSLADMEAIKGHILELKPRGGTNWSAGYKKGLELFESVKSSSEVENRIIFITDAMPNSGELRKKRLFGMIRDASKRGVYTTTIGVGVDFNNNLVEYISKTKGANYLSIHSSHEFKKRLDSEFDYLVTPLVFDLKMELVSNSFAIDRVYGTVTNQDDDKTIFKINTLFPSSTDDSGVKGGVVLAKLKKLKDGENLTLKVSYKDRDGNYHESKKEVVFDKTNHYDGEAIQKAMILTDYVNIIKNWLIDSRKSCHDRVTFPPFMTLAKRCIYPPMPPKEIKTWERRSCKFEVSGGYKKLFSIFLKEFQRQKYLLRDESLKKEEDILKYLINRSAKELSTKKDDWVQ